MKNTPQQKRMLFRFSLYGFLKNQQYYDAFLVLAFLEKGLTFFQIGLLIGFRELCANLLEIPSGAVADLHGRRASMLLSFTAYIASFATLALSTTFTHLLAAMFLFAIGQAFRTGTHKAMIFDWLRAQGQEGQRVRVYGYTRSWSKLGSALSALIAAALIFFLGQYSYVFWLCIPPYLLNIINFLGYPPEVEGPREKHTKSQRVHGHVLEALRQAIRDPRQRRLILESMGYEGTFKVTKDYLQPVLMAAAIGLPLLGALREQQRTALLVGITYSLLFLLSSAASRHAHRLIERHQGDETAAARSLWLAALAVYTLLIPALLLGQNALAIPLFVLIHVTQNLWRPALVSRLNAAADPTLGATTLSIESQTKSLFVMVAAPLLGWCADAQGLWTIGVLGTAVALLALGTQSRKP